MPRRHAIRTDRALGRRLATAVAAVSLMVVLLARDAGAWSVPAPLYIGAAREVFSVAGDPAGNAFAIINGESLDKPLLLVERWAAAKEENEEFVWRGARPLPGGTRWFTNALNTFDSFQTRGAGDGVGLIVWREVDRASGLATLNATVREPPLNFPAPIKIVADDLSPRADESAALNASADVLIALRYGRGAKNGRAAYVRRRSPGQFGQVRTLSASPTGSPVAALGGDGHGLVAWMRGTRVELRRIAPDGSASKTVRLGTGIAVSGLSAAAAANQSGAAIVVWRDAQGALRAARRSGPGALKASRSVRAIKTSVRVDGIASGVDAKGRAWVAWRELTSSTRRVRVANSVPGGAFKVTQLGTGKTLGAPSLIMRPGGGALVSWRSTGGWRARQATAKAVFAAGVAVSRGLVGSDLSVPRAAALAGPGARVDLVWPQIGDPPDPSGALIYNSFQDEDTAPGQ